MRNLGYAEDFRFTTIPISRNENEMYSIELI